MKNVIHVNFKRREIKKSRLGDHLKTTAITVVCLLAIGSWVGGCLYLVLKAYE